MKTVIVLSAVLAISLAQTYSSARDSLDVEAIVTNPATIQAFSKCFVDAGDCDETSAAFKKFLPEATQTACAKCTPAQKHMLKRYLQEVKNYPADLEALKQKYDPEGKYIEPLRAALAEA